MAVPEWKTWEKNYQTIKTQVSDLESACEESFKKFLAEHDFQQFDAAGVSWQRKSLDKNLYQFKYTDKSNQAMPIEITVEYDSSKGKITKFTQTEKKGSDVETTTVKIDPKTYDIVSIDRSSTNRPIHKRAVYQKGSLKTMRHYLNNDKDKDAPFAFVEPKSPDKIQLWDGKKLQLWTGTFNELDQYLLEQYEKKRKESVPEQAGNTATTAPQTAKQQTEKPPQGKAKMETSAEWKKWKNIYQEMLPVVQKMKTLYDKHVSSIGKDGKTKVLETDATGNTVTGNTVTGKYFGKIFIEKYQITYNDNSSNPMKKYTLECDATFGMNSKRLTLKVQAKGGEETTTEVYLYKPGEKISQIERVTGNSKYAIHEQASYTGDGEIEEVEHSLQIGRDSLTGRISPDGSISIWKPVDNATAWTDWAWEKSKYKSVEEVDQFLKNVAKRLEKEGIEAPDPQLTADTVCPLYLSPEEAAKQLEKSRLNGKITKNIIKEEYEKRLTTGNQLNSQKSPVAEARKQPFKYDQILPAKTLKPDYLPDRVTVTSRSPVVIPAKPSVPYNQPLIQYREITRPAIVTQSILPVIRRKGSNLPTIYQHGYLPPVNWNWYGQQTYKQYSGRR